MLDEGQKIMLVEIRRDISAILRGYMEPPANLELSVKCAQVVEQSGVTIRRIRHWPGDETAKVLLARDRYREKRKRGN